MKDDKKKKKKKEEKKKKKVVNEYMWDRLIVTPTGRWNIVFPPGLCFVFEFDLVAFGTLSISQTRIEFLKTACTVFTSRCNLPLIKNAVSQFLNQVANALPHPCKFVQFSAVFNIINC